MRADIDIQLKVWKDLALSKQLLMSAATEALGLNAECSTTELRQALDDATKRAKEADANIAETLEKTVKEVAEMKQLVVTSDKARIAAEEHIAIADKARESAERSMSTVKAESSDVVKKAKADVVDKQNKLKAISKALADTPENVIKKLKNLKKQKFDEAKLRTLAETQLKAVRKEKTELESELEKQKALVEQAATLVEKVRELHSVCNNQHTKIKSLSDDEKDLFEVPEIDEELLKAIKPEDTEENENENEKKKKKK
mgnify:CR=1 FL=1